MNFGKMVKNTDYLLKNNHIFHIFEKYLAFWDTCNDDIHMVEKFLKNLA